MSTKKKSIFEDLFKEKNKFGDLFKKKDCSCGVKIIPEEEKTDVNNSKKENKKK